MKTITHFRQLGGLKTKDGKTIKEGYFYRCGELTNVSEEEKEILESYHISKVFDLRRDHEALRNPDYKGSFDYYLLPALTSKSKRDRLFENKGAFINRFLNMNEAHYNYNHASFAMGYLEIPYNYDCVKPILDSLNEHKPILFHCFAGKDRTGVIAMIISAALGCDYDVCKADYMYHNQLMDDERKEYMEVLHKLNSTEWGIKAFDEANSANEDWFDAAWYAVFTSYACIEDYLKQEYGITQSQIDDWRAF